MEVDHIYSELEITNDLNIHLRQVSFLNFIEMHHSD